ncbi:uncharacterized protein LOC120014184 [Tripterygium wilfordii]|uniref:uncharacterized protein LOC120014184 n=1 Tax=Tripterygium wilfordii TaxID=458696 RepID=UPI0018F84FD4|nr:uncharacterized protein LOC120014184 [Tripterygium wilfordii]
MASAASSLFLMQLFRLLHPFYKYTKTEDQRCYGNVHEGFFWVVSFSFSFPFDWVCLQLSSVIGVEQRRCYQNCASLSIRVGRRGRCTLLYLLELEPKSDPEFGILFSRLDCHRRASVSCIFLEDF